MQPSVSHIVERFWTNVLYDVASVHYGRRSFLQTWVSEGPAQLFNWIQVWTFKGPLQRLFSFFSPSVADLLLGIMTMLRDPVLVCLWDRWSSISL